ncbi:glutamate--cysteine ligase [SAR86 cluster bacterium]|nr:glutamate--cysteine ligase [SAR86 cluster bacterium]
MSNEFLDSLENLDALNVSDFIKFSQRGIEKENLRSSNCSISLKAHPKAYGSSLTNSRITTDFSEALIELVTDPNKDLNKCLKELEDIVYFCLKNTDEDFWPASIPMSIEDEALIPIADYGNTNSGKLKKLYRVGLSHRYGSMMQTVSGIHYNFSFGDELFENWAKKDGETLREFKDKKYLSLVRNFRRNAWLITYFFGCSPIVPKAFAKGREHSLKELNSNDLFLENATCLRMGELGYISKSQDNLNIAYNNLEEYLADLKKALTTDHPRYKTLGTKVGGEYIQLNTAIIQIENEYYSSIRPKRLVGSGERPINALRDNGIEYVEIRALDNNIYDPFGISDETAIFLESFLFYCLLSEDRPCDADEINKIQNNWGNVVLFGRDKDLNLQFKEGSIPLRDKATEILDEMTNFESRIGDQEYRNIFKKSLETQRLKISDSNMTPSGKLLREITASGLSWDEYTDQIAKNHKEEILRLKKDVGYLEKQAKKSLEEFALKEAQEEEDFDSFLGEYLSAIE